MEDHEFSKEALDRVLTFEGYGNKSSPYWFLGMEEGGGSMEQLRERANLYEPLEDLYAAHQKLGLDITGYVSAWHLMSKLVMAIQGISGWQEKSIAQEYQATKLGRRDGETFLTDLMPLPCPSINAWPYPALFPTKADYLKKVRPTRINWLRSEVSAFRPQFIFCYGKGNWRHYEEIFSDVGFRAELNEQVLIGQRESTTIVLVRFLSPDLVSTELLAQIADRFGTEYKYG